MAKKGKMYEREVTIEELTPEEMEVFKRCADKAKLKGALLGAVGCGAVFAFQKGRGTALRFPKLTYALAFTIPFIYGSIYSPVKCVIKGIMNLKHSPLRDFIKLSIQQNGNCPKNQKLIEGKCSPDSPASKDSTSTTDNSKNIEYNKYGDRIDK